MPENERQHLVEITERNQKFAYEIPHREMGLWAFTVCLQNNCAAPCENGSSGICGQRRPRSDCACAQSDQDLHNPLTESLDTSECMNREQDLDETLHMHRMDLNLCILPHARRQFCSARLIYK